MFGFDTNSSMLNKIPQTTLFTWDLQGASSSVEVPRFIIVGFQTNKSGSQRQIPAILNNVGVKNIYVTLNSKKYPAVDYNLSFPRQQFRRASSLLASNRSSLSNNTVGSLGITTTPFPLYFFISFQIG